MGDVEIRSREQTRIRQKLSYRYRETDVSLDFELDRDCLTVISDAFAEYPRRSIDDGDGIDESVLTEYLRHEVGVYFEPTRVDVPIGGDPYVITRIDPDAGITVRDVDGDTVAVLLPPATEEDR